MPIKLNGSSSGYTQIEAAAVAGNNTLTLPTASGTLMTTGGSNTFTANQIISVTDNTNAALRITQLGTGLALRIEDSANPDSTPFVVTATGDVGVGIAAPTAKIHIQGASTASAVSNITNYSGLQIDGSLATTGTTGITFQDGGGGGAGIGFGRGTSYDTNITFYTNPSGTAVGGAMTERMRINSSGNVLVEATTYGGSGLSLMTPNSSGCYSILAAGGTGYHWRFGNVSNGAVGGISTSTTATTYATSSDYRLKEDVQPVLNAAERLMTLNPVNFAWKSNGSRVDGFIAHEAQEIVPEAVTGEKDAVDADGPAGDGGQDEARAEAVVAAQAQHGGGAWPLVGGFKGVL